MKITNYGWSTSRVLYVVTCAAPPAEHVEVLIQLARDANWCVCLIATPSALPFLNLPVLESLSGDPVRSTYKRPEQPDAFPPPNAIVVAPATFNTVNKWAVGISDTLALGLLTEAIGKGLPIVALHFSTVLKPLIRVPTKRGSAPLLGRATALPRTQRSIGRM